MHLQFEYERKIRLIYYVKKYRYYVQKKHFIFNKHYIKTVERQA